MATTVHLVRHGDYEMLDSGLGGRLPYPLSAAGRAQADAVAASLRLRPIAAVVSSPVRRALETAAPLSAARRLQLQIDPDFAEIDFAAWAGATFEALTEDPAWQRWNGFRSLAGVPGGETILAVQARAVAGLVRLAALFPDDEVAVVSHGDVIKAILAYVLGSPLDLMRRIEVGAGSISALVLLDRDVRVMGVNRVP